MLDRLLRSFNGRKIYYVPNHGNGGDALIAEGTYQLFERVNLDFVLTTEDTDVTDEVVVFPGGGNIVKEYENRYLAVLLRRWHKKAKRIVILPHTINAHSELLGELGENVDIVCRDARSFEYVKDTAINAKVHLSDDMAFYIDIEAVRSRKFLANLYRIPPTVVQKQVLRALYATYTVAIKRALSGDGNPGQLNAFRTDVEKTEIVVPADNWDVSAFFGLLMAEKWKINLVSNVFLNILGRYNTIRTNRLHVAIGSALLGKDVKLYPNSYYKNREVFSQSIEPKFPNVEWVEPGR